MSNPSSAVRDVGETLDERLQACRGGADQPQEFTGAGAVSGQFQRTQFLDCRVVIKMVFHAS